LLDEDSQGKRLIELLRNAGHDIITVSEAGLERKPDSFVLDYARQERRVLLTRNCDDFHTLISKVRDRVLCRML
jgi:predicted nuclease of predicted toxin-antitoxin system